MARVRTAVTVHPATVTAFSQGDVPTTRVRQKSARSGRVVTVQVDKRVWKTALKLAHGDIKLIEVLAFNECIVHSNENWRKR